MTEEIKINEQATKAQLQRLREAVSAMQEAAEIYVKWFTDIVEVLQGHFSRHKGDEPWIAHSE